MSWDGHWLLLVLRVPEQRRELRHRLTTQLAWAGFGSLGGGLWITPHVDREGLVRAEEPAQLLTFRAELGALGDTARVIDEAWDLDDLREHYDQFIEDFTGLEPEDDGAAFAAQTALVHAWRRFPFIDPDLPDDLLPGDWPRRDAHALFEACHERGRPPLNDTSTSSHERPQAHLRRLRGRDDRDEGHGRAATRRSPGT